MKIKTNNKQDEKDNDEYRINSFRKYIGATAASLSAIVAIAPSNIIDNASRLSDTNNNKYVIAPIMNISSNGTTNLLSVFGYVQNSNGTYDLVGANYAPGQISTVTNQSELKTYVTNTNLVGNLIGNSSNRNLSISTNK